MNQNGFWFSPVTWIFWFSYDSVSVFGMNWIKGIPIPTVVVIVVVILIQPIQSFDSVHFKLTDRPWPLFALFLFLLNGITNWLNNMTFLFSHCWSEYPYLPQRPHSFSSFTCLVPIRSFIQTQHICSFGLYRLTSWSVIRMDQALRFGMRVIHGLIA